MNKNFSNISLSNFSNNPFAFSSICSSSTSITMPTSTATATTTTDNTFCTATIGATTTTSASDTAAENSFYAFSPFSACTTESATSLSTTTTTIDIAAPAIIDNDDYNSIYNDIINMNLNQSLGDIEEDNECVNSHPYVKTLRSYQDKVFRNDFTTSTSSVVPTTTTTKTTTTTTPFNEIISFIEEQRNYYKKLNQEMINENNIYFNIFTKNIKMAFKNQKKINQLEHLLTDFNSSSEQLNNIKNQINYFKL